MRKLAFLLCTLATTLCAQDAGVLLGTVVDPSEAPVPGAQVRLTDPSRNVSREMTSTLTGDYVFDSLTPGTYSIEVVKEGFNTLKLERVVVRVRDRQNLMLRLTLSGITNSVTVQDTVEGVATDNSTGSAVDQEFIRHLPVNGRGIDSLIKMAPGVVSGAGPGGGFNVNGLRSNTNYYTLDGVSLNGVSGPMGGGMGGGGPRGGGGMGGPPPGGGGMGGGGGEGSLGTDAVSLDSLSQVRVQTSTFAPEFGRTPGAQVSMMSRGGSNQFHGSLYAYWRDDKFNANDWFANASGYPRGDMYQKQFGGTVGGPVLKNRTYFFLSAESLRLLDPETALATVPSLATRAAAPTALQPYLNAFPIPNGPALDDGAAQFSAVFSNPMERKSYSARIDHTISGKHTAFVRATLSPSNSTNRFGQFTSPNVVSNSDGDSKGFTGALTSSLNPNTTNDLRVNYTASENSSNTFMDNFGGAVPLTDARVFPAGITSKTGEFSLQVMGISGYSFGTGSRNKQWQTNIVDSLTMVAGNHTYKAGVDYRIIAPTYYNTPYSVSSNFYGLLATDEGSLLSGESLNSIVTSRSEAVYPSFHNISAYLQDTVQAGPRTSFNFGVRWDINPAPGVRSGPKPFALSSAFDGRLSQNEALYDTRWSDIAPRFGFSHMIKSKPGKEFLVRFGFGAFHDLGYGSTAAAFSGAPYNNVKTLSLETFPLSAANKEAPGLPPTKPYGMVAAADRSLQSPIVYQWNMTLEQNLGRGQIVSAGYVGTRGRRLLLTSSSRSFSDDYDIISVASNGADSDYHALQLQYQRRLSRRFQAQASYTWSHSIDTSSSDAGAGFASLFGGERGNSDYDIRQNLNITGSYLFPSTSIPVVKTVLGNWYADFMMTARTGLPFDIQGVTATTSSSSSTTRGLFAQVRPDYNGQQVWLTDSNVPAGRRLNQDAFAAPAKYTTGNLGRNALSGYKMAQVDFSLRRQIPITDSIRFHLALQAFNVTNTPNFLNPTRNEGASMASANFGVSTRTLGQGMGGGAGSFYRSGGPRSLQFTLRLQF